MAVSHTLNTAQQYGAVHQGACAIIHDCCNLRFNAAAALGTAAYCAKVDQNTSNLPTHTHTHTDNDGQTGRSDGFSRKHYLLGHILLGMGLRDSQKVFDM